MVTWSLVSIGALVAAEVTGGPGGPGGRLLTLLLTLLVVLTSLDWIDWIDWIDCWLARLLDLLLTLAVSSWWGENKVYVVYCIQKPIRE